MAILTITANYHQYCSAGSKDAVDASNQYQADNYVGYDQPAQLSFLLIDFSSLPDGAVISSAIYNAKVQAITGDTPYDTCKFQRVTRVFVPSQTTWNSYSTGNVWTTGGGDVTNTDMVTVTNPAVGDWVVADVTNIIKYAQANTGKIAYIRHSMPPIVTARCNTSYYTNTDATPSNRPYLEITYIVQAKPQIMIF